jgi:hypothetical protein
VLLILTFRPEFQPNIARRMLVWWRSGTSLPRRPSAERPSAASSPDLPDPGASTPTFEVAPTAADARDVMVEGESGLLAIGPPQQRPQYEPTKRRLTWPNGAIATTYSADEVPSSNGLPVCGFTTNWQIIRSRVTALQEQQRQEYQRLSELCSSH